MLDVNTIPKVDSGNINLLIALPAYCSQTYVQHNRSLRALEHLLRKLGVSYNIAETQTESLIPRARNAFANICCFDRDAEGKQYTHLLFLDVDIGFNPDNVVQMLGWDQDICALPYPCKTINWSYIVAAVKRGVEEPLALSRMGSRPIINSTEPTLPFNVDEPTDTFPQLGTGLLLIKRGVFEKMAENENRRYILMPGERLFGPRDFAYDFFQIGINPKTRYYDSEDYRFCLDAKELGFKTWLLPWAVTSHTGQLDFWMDMKAQASIGIPAPDLQPRTDGFAPLTI